MEISAIETIPKNLEFSGLINNAAENKELNFSSWLEKEITTANQQVLDADLKIREYAVGETDNLHQVMMSINKAKTSFELVLEVRNRLLEGYQEIMRMQI